MSEDRERDERVSIPLDPETALRALLKVDPDSEPVERKHGPGEGHEPPPKPA